MKEVKWALLVVLTISVGLLLAGCSRPNQPPTASFTASPKSGEASLEVSLDASSSTDPDGSIISYDWDFGDGSTGSGETVTHTYDSAGDFTVELTVIDDEGATDTTTKAVDVSPTPTPNDPPTSSFIATPTSTSDGAPLEVSFDASGSTDPDGTIDSYSWDFDDGSTGTGETVNHTFDSAGDYTVELTVTDNDGANDSTTSTVSVTNAAPTASFTADPSPEDGTVNVEVGTEVSFDAGNSEDPDGSIASYNWDFGDDAMDTGETPTHSYDSEGTYTVTLTVTDDDGAEDTDSVEVKVEASGPEPPPPPG